MDAATRETLTTFAAPQNHARAFYGVGFLSGKRGWVAACGVFPLMGLPGSDDHSLFPTQEAALAAAVAYKQRCRRELEEQGHG